ncbi:MAG TPA: hypothetical protein V6D28_26420 [Leptolyngbyaceae cyanobacterium]
MNNYFKFAGVASLVMGALIADPTRVEATTVRTTQPIFAYASNVLKKTFILQQYTPQCIGDRCKSPVDSRGSGTR